MLKINKLILCISSLLFVGHCFALSRNVYFHVTNESNLSSNLIASSGYDLVNLPFQSVIHSFSSEDMNVVLSPNPSYILNTPSSPIKGMAGVSISGPWNVGDLCEVYVKAVLYRDAAWHPSYLLVDEGEAYVVSKSKQFVCWAQKRDVSHVEVTVMNMPQ